MITNNFNGNNNTINQINVVVNIYYDVPPQMEKPLKSNLRKSFFDKMKPILLGALQLILFLCKLPVGLLTMFLQHLS